MKTPKSLERLTNQNGLFLESLSFYATMGGPTKKGFAIVDADSNELLEIEPVFYSNGDRWKIVNRTDERPGILYAKSLKGIDKKVGTLRPGWTGYKFSAQTSGRNGKLTAAGVTNQAN